MNGGNTVKESDFQKEKEEAINESLQEAYERRYEEERLEYSKNVIKAEILNYISKRKEFSQCILDYRKNLLDEYRDDEDKVAEYFDHERFVKEETFKVIDRRLKELLILDNSPYFGRVDFSEDDSEDKETIYVGRFGMTPEGSYEPLVVDWRAPVASLFYSGKLGKTTYRAPMGEIEADVKLKRQFIIKRGKLTGMFDSAVEVKDDILKMVLSENSSKKLKDIIMTIQEEQDNIIRQPRRKTVVVNGVAGSGKTTIALHRVAYLLYNYRDVLQDKVLILGPNSIFMEYISMVLPSLGEVGVKQRTFKDYAMEVLDMDDMDLMSFKDYMEKVMQQDETFIIEIIYKNSEDFVKELDKKLYQLDNEYYKFQDVYLQDKLVIDSKEIEDLFRVHYINMPLFRRSKKIRRIIFSKIKDLRDDMIRQVQRHYKKLLESMTVEQLNTNGSQVDFMRRNKIREILRASLDTKAALKWLGNPSLMEVYQEINGGKELIYDDLAPLLYLTLKLKGNIIKEDIRHVVIDEAQDYNTLQFRVIKELTKCSSMTIVGDTNQRLVPFDGKIAMTGLKDVFKDFDLEEYSLEKSYRSTREIMEFANGYLKENKVVPLVRQGDKVEVLTFSDNGELEAIVKNKLKEYKEKDYESIAIICKDLKTIEAIGEPLRKNLHIKVMEDEYQIFTAGTVMMPSYYAKGLEFDAVILLEDGTVEEGNDENIKYVMSTRALHNLMIVRKV
ncbi:MAG: AAA family ATPase [Clostridia bacterium]|nr:AAA family ATPase [Clostridia bacterium]